MELVNLLLLLFLTAKAAGAIEEGAGATTLIRLSSRVEGDDVRIAAALSIGY
jgi:hypothetical protein